MRLNEQVKLQTTQSQASSSTEPRRCVAFSSRAWSDDGEHAVINKSAQLVDNRCETSERRDLVR